VSWIILIFILLLVSIKNRNLSNNRKVSVIIPAYNESETVGDVVKVVKTLNYVDEVIVVDDGSEDDSANIAKDAGATVIKHSENKGKGAALRTGFKKSTGDIVAFIDADISNLTSKQADQIIKPILEGKADVTKTKFKRKAGRVTELTAKPLLNFFFPELKFEQPLSGQFAAKRAFLDSIKFEDDYGVDVGIVLDADVKGMKVNEVDIGKIDHKLSSLKELNIVAYEVARTIVDRAMEYGRVTMMDALGNYIRMCILGLSLASFGFFSLFFIKFIPPTISMIISVIGIIMAVYYIILLIKRSLNVFLRSDGRSRNIRSFLYMHFPIIVSSLILMAMLATLLGSVHVDEGKISIELSSRNLIYWTEPKENRSFDVRGPYTVDSALENENNSLRVPKAAMDSLLLNYGDSIYINSTKYDLNETRPGEENILRIPADARINLGLNIADVIADSNIRNVFKDLYAEKILSLEGDIKNNLTLKEGIFIKTVNENGRIINIYVDGKKVTSTTGILKNGQYSIYVNGIKYKTIEINEKNVNASYFVYWGKYVIKIEIGNESKTDVEFAPSGEGKFLNFIFPSNSSK